MYLLILLILTSFCIIHAEEYPDPKLGFYVGAGVVATKADNAELKTFTNSGINNEIEVDTGHQIDFMLGNQIHKNWRIEFEASYGENNLKSIKIQGIDLSWSGQITRFNAMTNIIYNFRTGPLGFYIGGGAGLTYIETRSSNISLNNGTIISATGGSDIIFNSQFLAGVDLPLSNSFDVFAGYKLQISDDFNIKGNDYKSPLIHGVSFGIRGRF